MRSNLISKKQSPLQAALYIACHLSAHCTFQHFPYDVSISNAVLLYYVPKSVTNPVYHQQSQGNAKRLMCFEIYTTNSIYLSCVVKASKTRAKRFLCETCLFRCLEGFTLVGRAGREFRCISPPTYPSHLWWCSTTMLTCCCWARHTTVWTRTPRPSWPHMAPRKAWNS
jgi:hypothetical protein